MQLRSRYLPPGWYPDSATAIQTEIEGFLQYINSFQFDSTVYRGGLVPHAGWYFSGRLAALVFHACARNIKPDVVALFGGHLGSGAGIIYADQAWDTPLGPVACDLDLAQPLAEELGLKPEGAQTNDNTVEIQIPLVKYFFPESRLVALRAPHTERALDLGLRLAQLANAQGKTMVAIGSTDLTHYGSNYGFIPRGSGPEAVRWVREINDKGFIDKCLDMDSHGLLKHAAENNSACSAGGAAAAVSACRAMGAEQGRLLDYYTSYDIMPGQSFVGYAGIVF
jgi:hypothetical protein